MAAEVFLRFLKLDKFSISLRISKDVNIEKHIHYLPTLRNGEYTPTVDS
jgi:hypothetical protein